MDEIAPEQAIAALSPLARAVTALAVLAGQAADDLRNAVTGSLSKEESERINKQLVSTAEAACWANAIACWVEANEDSSAKVIRPHDVAWPEWQVDSYHLRVERLHDRYARSGRRDAFQHQIPLDEFNLASPNVGEWQKKEAAQARNVTGTMVRSSSGSVVGVRFHTVFGHEDLWSFTVRAEDVAGLLATWSDADPWVRLASSAKTWSHGYHAISVDTPNRRASAAVDGSAAADDAVTRRVRPGARPILPPTTVTPKDLPDTEEPPSATTEGA